MGHGSEPPADADSGAAGGEEWVDTLAEKTGRTLGERLIPAEGTGREGDDPASYLKAAAEWVDEMFSGKKAALRPVYEALLRAGSALGDDVRVRPCKTVVPLYRRHVFAQIKPTANARIDLGLALKDTPATGRLIDTGGFVKRDRISHRIPVARIEEVDAELLGWLKAAYDMDAVD